MLIDENVGSNTGVAVGLEIIIDGVVQNPTTASIDLVGYTGGTRTDISSPSFEIFTDAFTGLELTTEAVVPTPDGPVTHTFNFGNMSQTASQNVTIDGMTLGVTSEPVPTTATITVEGRNDGPVAVDAAISVDENSPVTGTVTGTDADTSDTLTFSGSGTTANGSVTINADGSYEYTPNAGFDGSDSFTYTVSDGNGGTDTGTVDVTVNDTNANPVFINGINSLQTQGGRTSLGVSQGTAVETRGDFTLELWFKADSVGGFQVLASGDQPGVDNTGTINLALTSSGVIEVEINNQGFFTTPGGEVTAGEWVHVALTHDTDTGASRIYLDGAEAASGTLPSASNFVDFALGQRGLGNPFFGEIADVRIWETERTEAEIAANLGCQVDPASAGLVANWRMELTGGVIENSATGASANPAPLSLSGNVGVGGSNAPVTLPGPVNPAASGDEDTDISGIVLATDPDGDAITFSKASDPANGSVTVNADGTYTYTPNADFNGSDIFDVTVTDVNGGFSTTSVAITVNPVNDAPVLDDPGALDVDENTDGATIATLTATDAEGAAVTFSVTDPRFEIVNGVLKLVDGVTLNHEQTDSIDLVITTTDATGASADQTVTIAVNDLNDNPTAGAVAQTIQQVDGLAFLIGGRITGGVVDSNGDGVPDTVEDERGAQASGEKGFVLDFDGDGDQDFFGMQSSYIWVHNNRGDVTGDGLDDFGVSRIFLPGTAYDVTFGDFTGEGDIDIVVAHSGGLSVIEMESDLNGNGVVDSGSEMSIAYTLSQSPGGTPFGVTTADINGDGLDDVVAPAFSRGPVTDYYQQADNTFVANQIAGTSLDLSLFDIGSGDFDGDGDIDLVGGQWSNNLQAYYLENLGDTDGDGFNDFAVEQVSETRHRCREVEVVDIDRDGDLDFVSAEYVIVSGVGGIVYVNEGDGVFTEVLPTMPGSNDGLLGLAYGDIDDDGGRDDGSITAEMNEDQATILTIDLLADTADEDGDTLIISDLTQTSGATVGSTLNGSDLEIDPAAFQYLDEGETETLVFDATVDDQNGGIVVREVTVTVTGENDAPVAMDDAFTGSEADDTITGNVLGNDADVDGDTLTADLLDAELADTSFEDNGNLGTSFVYTPSGSAWQFSGLSGIAGNDSAFTDFGGAVGPDAPDGNQALLLQSNSDAGQTGVVTQTFNAGVGTYLLAFSAAQRNYIGTTQDFRILVDGVEVATVTPSSINYEAFAFEVELGEVAGEAYGAHTITFEALNSGGAADTTAFVDDISFDLVADVTLAADGTLVVTPNTGGALDVGESEEVTVAYCVSDGNGGTDVATATVTIEGFDEPLIDYAALGIDPDSAPVQPTLFGSASAAQTAATTGTSGDDVMVVRSPNVEDMLDDNARGRLSGWDTGDGNDILAFIGRSSDATTGDVRWSNSDVDMGTGNDTLVFDYITTAAGGRSSIFGGSGYILLGEGADVMRANVQGGVFARMNGVDIDAGTGNDLLEFEIGGAFNATGTREISFSGTVELGSGDDTFSVELEYTGAATNGLVTGTFNGGAGADEFTFDNSGVNGIAGVGGFTGTVNGGDDDDVFNFAVTTLGAGSTTGFLNGDGGSDTLNMVGWDLADLSYNAATGVLSFDNDTLVLTGIESVFADDGHLF